MMLIEKWLIASVLLCVVLFETNVRSVCCLYQLDNWQDNLADLLAPYYQQEHHQRNSQKNLQWRTPHQWPAPPLRIQQIHVLEDKDYPPFLFENYTGVGQVSGITAFPTDDLAIFHRADREWRRDSFDGDSRIKNTSLIKADTIMILSRDDGHAVLTLGANLFSMPHGIASDSQGNLWTTDAGLHQVMRLPLGQAFNEGNWTGSGNSSLVSLRVEPDIVLGEAFEPGSDSRHFCQPAEIKVSSQDELVFVADGYCNNRVVVLDSRGNYLKSFGENIFGPGSVIHSLALVEKRNMICVAERTNGKIYCFRAGLDGDIDTIGKLINTYDYPFGMVYAIVGIGPNNLLVSSKRYDSERYDMAMLNIISGEVTPTWISTDLLAPHSITKTHDGRYAYVADLSRDSYKKVFQFKIIRGKYLN